MVVLATVGCLLYSPQRDPMFRMPPRPPGPTSLNAAHQHLKLSSCDYDHDEIGTSHHGRGSSFQYTNLIVAARLNHDVHAIDATPARRRARCGSTRLIGFAHGRSHRRHAKTLTARGYDVAHDDARVGRVGAASWPLAIREGVYNLPNFATINSGFRGPNPRWRFRRVFHQTRDPLRTILSRANSVGMMVSPWVYSDPLLFRDGLGYCPGFPPVVEFAAWREDRTAEKRGASWTPEMRLRVALFHYVFWNDWINAYADWTYKSRTDAQGHRARWAPRPPARPSPPPRRRTRARWTRRSRGLGRVTDSPVVWRRATRRASLATTAGLRGLCDF